MKRQSIRQQVAFVTVSVLSLAVALTPTPALANSGAGAPRSGEEPAMSKLLAVAETVAVGSPTPSDAVVPILQSTGDAVTAELNATDVRVELGDSRHDTVSQSGQYAIAEGSTITYAVSYPAEGETRFSAVLEASTAGSPRWAFPEGTELLLLDDGSVSLSDGEQFLGGIDAPWAVDAAGTSLSTHYEIAGATLTQIVDTTGATFPVVADPKVNFYGPYIQVHLNRHESITAVSGYAACAAILSKSPVPFAKALQIACGAVTAIGSAQLVAGKCISIHYVVGVGGPAGIWWPWIRKC